MSVTFFVLAAPGWATAASDSVAGTTSLDPVVDTGTGVVDDVTDAVGPVVDDGIDTVTDTVVDPVTDTVDTIVDDVTGALDPVTDTVDPVLDPVTDTVDPILDDVTDTVVDPVTDTTKPVTDTVTGTTEPVRDAVRDGTRAVIDPVRDRTQPVTDRVGEDLPPVGELIDDGGLLSGTTTTPRRDGARPGPGQGVARTTVIPGRDAGGSHSVTSRPASPLSSLLGVADPDASTLTPAPVLAGVRDSAPIEQFARGLAEASRQFSFPLTVAALVLLFLAVQGRVDARDPKLAARPEDEELVFA